MIMKHASAVQIGNRHRREGGTCQDSVSTVTREGLVCSVLSDGAGSVAHSERVSGAVTRALAAYVAEHFDRLYEEDEPLVKRDILSCCRAAVAEEAPGMEADCTLLMAAMADDGRCLACHLGDGVIFAVDSLGDARLLSTPENGENAWETFFVAGPNPMRHLRLYRELADVRTILLSSDGIGFMLYFAEENRPARVVGRLHEWLANLDGETVSKKFDQELDGFFRSRTGDDMSIAMIARVPEEQRP